MQTHSDNVDHAPNRSRRLGVDLELPAVASSHALDLTSPARKAALSAPTRSDVILRFASVGAATGSRLVRELALRPGFHPKPEMPPTTRKGHEARGLGYWF
jgi:hypothetical protein